MPFECRICRQISKGNPIALPETMFESTKVFDYFKCENCGCLQIEENPGDMREFYSENYYSYNQTDGGTFGSLKARIRTFLAIYGSPAMFAGKAWFELGQLKCVRDARIKRDARILDVGCGAGNFMSQLRNVGFHNVSGVDPFIESDIVHKNGVTVKKCDLSEVEDKFDIVMMHHSLEHIWDQKQTVGDLHRVLRPGGRCIIRIPTSDSYAWDEYGADWAQLDPPRHFYLHSRESIRRLITEAGFRVTAIVDDPATWSLLGSEKIRRGLPLLDPTSNTTQFEALFSPQAQEEMWRKTLELCAAGRGDQITVHAQRV